MDHFCQYHKLYRLLRSDEDPIFDKITAKKKKKPDAYVTVHDHVSFGSKMIIGLSTFQLRLLGAPLGHLRNINILILNE